MISIIIAFAIYLALLFTKMKRFRFRFLFWTACLVVSYGLTLGASRPIVVLAQEPGPSSTPTVGAPEGMFITVISTEPQINVRAGPNQVAYPVVGFLLPGSIAPALGRSPGGDWIQVAYDAAPGGVGGGYSALVS